jgi:crotonobetainyl-CoA:carnitine CoA-transferase CaiB-like acyl-CoA transferase
VQTAGQLLVDPQSAAIELLEDFELPGAEGITTRVPRLPINLSHTPASITGPPPTLGEQGWEVLKEAGFSNEEIADLVVQGIVRLPKA